MEICSMNEHENVSKCSSNTMSMDCFMVLSTPAQKIGIIVLCCFFGTLCIFENSLVLYLIFSSIKIRRKPSYVFISSLALADLLACINFVGNFVRFHVFKVTDSKDIFLLKLGAVNTSFTASLGSLLLMALDRYVCICKPSEYKIIITRKKALVALAVLWMTTTFIAFLPLIGWNCCTLNSTCSELFPFVDDKYLSGWISLVMILLVCIIYAYMHVLWKAHKHTAYMEKRQTQAVQQNAKMRLDVTLAKTLAIVLTVLMVCWSPMLALMTYSVFVSLNNHIKTVFAFCSTLCLVNSMVNPIVYALRSRELRSSLRNACSWCRKLKIPGSNQEVDSTQKLSTIGTVCEDAGCSTDWPQPKSEL
ncbi:PREDICTED: cannabinoid receptor 2 [Gavialis gangeticus]|uniref:cannabinoid receptor 2 n=1 Tax=Gavialis gangeticus TaxID=94835 RepID=UPI00092E634C|nr:PREDICTED: cannabinoid receptor 2 [Gavialis gangeticus]